MDNIVGLTDIHGHLTEEYLYTPFGKLISEQSKIDNPYLFAGRRYDAESGLYYFRNRDYAPESRGTYNCRLREMQEIVK
ncbi:MAG: RHS repeat-associated core domain-containing protein [Candidatus Saelkia tenebricola]|nr:RHS repeat-associated core domain-containing protein [Candidatus Saelkia tenebricola]